MAILSSQATRRDAKSYFGRFGPEMGNQVNPKYLAESHARTKQTASSTHNHTALLKLCHADTLSNVDAIPGLA